ncbi:HupE/UreJ family protein (plasmid) [Deinococcus sp. KNUC1210]|uniref:HupE/UreJ family protein n=1 Tax=Deinococcus sp. KNUC1210 TaxID=2917691 RepID=UPI001EF0BCD4|nr:HupE/UreJ family protein [Deinococcus sp. KNUC1210]ULH17785.1 HupE/UreJ family protein [Deinococcus sp. KNUC1210]
MQPRLPSLLLCALLLLWPSASAHLMVSQKGTLNLSGTGAYLLVSLPVSAFSGIDDDADGLLSSAELSLHTQSITGQLQAGLQLRDSQGARPLQGVMLTLSPSSGQEGQPADQLIVMGRYALSSGTQPLSLRAALWGRTEAERSLNLTITRALKQPELLILTPLHPQAGLYEPALKVVSSYLQLGIEHVLTGLDHLLFLLVVVTAGWGWRRLFTALTVFTLGHALSLIGVVFGGLSVPAGVVEPAIAATIVGLALFDWWAARQAHKPPLGARLALIFGCSLIHGLGLGGALAALGLNPAHQWLSLLGFNLGIETAQLGVSLLALAGLAAVRGLFGTPGLRAATALASVGAVLVGSAWFVQRVFLA